MAKRLVSVRPMHKRNGFNTLALTVIADQMADTDAFMHSIMLLNLDGNIYFLESCVHSSNKVTVRLTEDVFDFSKYIYTGS